MFIIGDFSSKLDNVLVTTLYQSLVTTPCLFITIIHKKLYLCIHTKGIQIIINIITVLNHYLKNIVVNGYT